MRIKGIEKIREKLPDYPGQRIAIIPLTALFVMLLGYVFMIFLDVSARIFPYLTWLGILEPYLPIFGSMFVGGTGILLIRRLWNQRDAKKAEFGDLAYQKMIKTGVSGVFLIPAVIFHAFTSVRSLPPGPPVNELTILWSQSLLPMIGVPSEIDIVLRLVLFGLFLVTGMLLVRSAISTFGLDYMVVVYLYFPEESEVQENEIYSVVRHPAYLAGVLFGIAGLFLRFSVYSIVFCLIVYILFKLHLRTEERELIERFGDGFVEYMEKVPAFFVSPKNYGKFFRFLRHGI